MKVSLTDFSERQLKLMYRLAQDEQCRLRIHMKAYSSIPGLQKMFQIEIADFNKDIEDLNLWQVQLSSALKEIILRERISDN